MYPRLPIFFTVPLLLLHQRINAPPGLLPQRRLALLVAQTCSSVICPDSTPRHEKGFPFNIFVCYGPFQRSDSQNDVSPLLPFFSRAKKAFFLLKHSPPFHQSKLCFDRVLSVHSTGPFLYTFCLDSLPRSPPPPPPSPRPLLRNCIILFFIPVN